MLLSECFSRYAFSVNLSPIVRVETDVLPHFTRRKTRNLKKNVDIGKDFLDFEIIKVSLLAGNR